MPREQSSKSGSTMPKKPWPAAWPRATQVPLELVVCIRCGSGLLGNNQPLRPAPLQKPSGPPPLLILPKSSVGPECGALDFDLGEGKNHAPPFSPGDGL